MASAEHALPKKNRRGMRVAIVIVAAILVVVLGLVIAVALLAKNVGDTFDAKSNKMQVEEVFPEESKRPEPSDSKAQTILLLGSDTRGTIDTEDISATQDGRSDSIMVLRIPADRDQIFVTSIMRDSWVDIDGVGEAKINAAMAYGGVPLTVQTVEGLIGSRIDHVAVIDFEGFKDITDALGGIGLTNPIEFSAGGHTFEEGPIKLDGEQALAFVRERKSFVDGDYQRARNQQLFLKGLLRTALSRATLTDPGRIQDTVAAISPHMAVDSEFDSGYLMGLLPSLYSVRTDDIVMFTAPTAGVGESADGQSIVNLDWDRMAKLKEAFQNDTLDQYVAQEDLNTY